MTAPNPGSDEALRKGCTCPVLDNGHGRGSGYKDSAGTDLFYINSECPIHGENHGTQLQE